MNTIRFPLIVLLLTACSQQPAPAGHPSAPMATASTDAASASPSMPSAVPGGQAAPLPTLVIHKTPTCGCCTQWSAHMQEAGFPVEMHDHASLDDIKQALGVPPASASCHTALVDGYFIEGHVPAAEVKRLLQERPSVRGLAVPGMPAGSPGMEMPDGRVDAYVVEAITQDGQPEVFARY